MEQGNLSCPVCRHDIARNELQQPPRMIRQIFESLEYRCNNCNAPLTSDQFESHKPICTGQSSEATQEPSHPPMRATEDNVIYINCNPEDEIGGECLRTIWGLANQAIWTRESSKDSENKEENKEENKKENEEKQKEEYERCCEALKKKNIYPLPEYRRSQQLPGRTTNIDTELLKELIPRDFRGSGDLISAAGMAFNNHIPLGDAEIGTVGIFLSGKTLQIVPYYTSYEVIEESGSAPTYKLSIMHRHQKFILTELQLLDIVKNRNTGSPQATSGARVKAKWCPEWLYILLTRSN